MDSHNFHWDPEGGPVYTDGSATHAMYPEVAAAGAAAVQITSDETIKYVLYSLDQTVPTSAVVSEHVALIHATMFAISPIHVVSDCQAVVSLLRNSAEQRLSYKVKMAGFEAPTNFHMVQHTTKVKSRCSNEKAQALGQLQHHRGNELADSFAIRARPTHGEIALDEFLHKQQSRHKLMVKVTAHISLAKQRVRLPEKAKGQVAGRRLRLRKINKQPEFWVWAQANNRWVCKERGRRSGRRESHTKCRSSVEHAQHHHQTHRILSFLRVGGAGALQACVIRG